MGIAPKKRIKKDGKSSEKNNADSKKKATQKSVKDIPSSAVNKVHESDTVKEIITPDDLKKFLKEFNPQHRTFCDEYLKTMNATDSYRKAGYKATGNSAEVNASKLLRNTKVQKYLQYRIKLRSITTDLDINYVVKRLKTYADAKISDFYYFTEDGQMVLKDLSKMPDDLVRQISEIKQKKDDIKIKLFRQDSAIRDLGKHIGMWGKGKEQRFGEGGGSNLIIIKEYVVPQIKNVCLSQKPTKQSTKELIENYIKERQE